MAENAEFTSVRTGDSILNNDGITIGTGDKKVSLTNTGLNNGGNKITNVADGTADSDAVNVRQMNNIQNSIVAKGLDFAGNDYDEKDESTKIHKNLGERFEVVGKLKSDMEASSDNIRTRVIKDKQQLEILMSERPVFKEVTAGTSEKTRVVIDRKSTRLNSSHANISYAVFCLKKKKKKHINRKYKEGTIDQPNWALYWFIIDTRIRPVQISCKLLR